MVSLWQPSEECWRASAMQRFIEEVAATYPDVQDYNALHLWSVAHFREFWTLWLRRSGIAFEGDPEPVCAGSAMWNTRFFPDLRLNFAENLLRYTGDRIALDAIDELGRRTTLTFADLRAQAAGVAAGLLRLGVTKSDRVCGILPNGVHAPVVMLGATSIGAIWSSCSPDFGVAGVIDRFSQIAPKVLFCVNGYVYGGKVFSLAERLEAIVEQLPSLEAVVVIPYSDTAPLPKGPKVVLWNDFVDTTVTTLPQERFPMDHPLYILYSSGTTGVPKCIVHGAGGTLLQHTKELMLHGDVGLESRVTYYTTCGWMMWNWLMSALYTGCRTLVYDGAPNAPTLSRLWDLVASEGITHFGTSARFLASCRGKLEPWRERDLRALRVIWSTGSPLLPEDFDFVYAHVKSDVALMSISGGTDIVSCFMLGNPVWPVHRGELQCKGLGMDVVAQNEHGVSVVHEKWELVCRTPFPSQPLGFWNDDGGEKYRGAYFKDGTRWFHGDYIEITESEGTAGGIVVYGRSDATLNPGGVRIGTAEIYRLVETLPEVDDSLVIAQPWEGDVRIILFVKLAPGVSWDTSLEESLRLCIRAGASPRHVPKLIFPVDQIPYTLSGKKVELAVRDIFSGLTPKNEQALIEPSALELYRVLAASLT